MAGTVPHTYITDIEIQQSESLIRVGTHGRGIFEGSLNPDVTNIVEQEAAAEDCYQIFPNPTANIAFVQDLPENIRTRLYDVSGHYLATFISNEIDFSNQPAGIYYLVFTDKDGTTLPCTQRIVKE